MGDDTDHRSRVSELRSRSPGEDSEDPYGDVDISELPDWWERAILEFEAHGLRPYRPPRFEDGSLKYEVVKELASALDVTISFIRLGSECEGWSVRVDGEPIGEVGRHRSPDGYTVFEMDCETFEELVRSSVEK